jgi:ABC-type nitrate/sulfonate/bicarbonate transport system permease component
MAPTYRREIKNKFAFMEKEIPVWVSISGMIVLILLWEIICRLGIVSELYLPSPTSILKASWVMLTNGELIGSARASLYRIGMGFFIGSFSGILIGLILGFSKTAEALGNPLIYSIYPIPKIALLPLIILWLGIGEISKVTIISLGVFFPVVINTYSGVKHVDKSLIMVAISFGSTRFSLIRKVILPGALPMIFAGLKLAAGTSLLLLVAAEMIAAKEGIGSIILHYGDLMLTTKLMVGVLALSVLGVLFTNLIGYIEKLIIRWKK